MSGPTIGAKEQEVTKTPTNSGGPSSDAGQTWERKPLAAMAVRVAIFLLPILAGWLAVRYTASMYYRPQGGVGFVLWLFQAIAVALSTSLIIERLLQRVVPITSLLNMALVFPDSAPSRYSVALKSGTVRKIRDNIVLSDDPQEAAEEALGLVAELGRHERLTRGHVERVRTYADMLGEEMGLTEEERHKLRWGVLLHDVGKLAVPADILNKPSRPTEEEWEILKQHPAVGGKMLEPLSDWLGPWSLAAAEHHERWDGGGYPLGLKGEEISLAGRIAAVADAYDVITSKRSYKDKISPDAARRELVRCSGKQFDPAVVRAFLRLSFEDKRRTGWLGWLLEVPTLARLVASAGSAAAPAAAAAAITAAAVTGTTPADQPDSIAFVDDVPVATTVEPAPTTTIAATTIQPTTSAAPVTTAPPATTVVSTTTTASTTTTTVAPSTTATTTAVLTTSSPDPTSTLPPAASTTSPPTTVGAVVNPTVLDDIAIIAAGDEQKLFVLANDQPGAGSFDISSLRVIGHSGGPVSVTVHVDHLHYLSDAAQQGDYSVTYEICNTDGGCSQANVVVSVYQP